MTGETDEDESLIDADGRVVVFSCDRFVKDICYGDCCFVCGAKPGSRPFNNEHVLPRWLLKRYGLFEDEITLPNGTPHDYRHYLVPCCQACNAFLGGEIETPVSKLLKGDYETVRARLAADAYPRLYVWFCLVFLKTHLKDRLLPAHRDRRIGDAKIADGYDWGDLHHIHAVVRAPVVAASIRAHVIGTMLICRTLEGDPLGPFDWIDLLAEQTVALRTGGFGIICVLNDGGAVGRLNLIGNVDAPLRAIQFREVVAKVAAANVALLNRPRFWTRVPASAPPTCVLDGDDVSPQFGAYDPKRYGKVLAFVLRDLLGQIELAGETDPEIVKAMLATGRYTFLPNQGRGSAGPKSR